jgi:hypothetical protein
LVPLLRGGNSGVVGVGHLPLSFALPLTPPARTSLPRGTSPLKKFRSDYACAFLMLPPLFHIGYIITSSMRTFIAKSRHTALPKKRLLSSSLGCKGY